MDWTTFADPASRCQPCGLWQISQVYALPGEGNPNARLAVIGEAPGGDEEDQQRNFVGRAGDLLNDCIREARLLREDIWIANSVRCRPNVTVTERGQTFRKNRTPTPHELVCCNGFVTDELLALKPKAILCMGDIATKAILHDPPPGGVLENIGKVLWSERFNCWVILTVHPSYLLRRQGERFFLTAALIKASRYAEGTIGEPAPVDYRVIESLDEAIALRDHILRHAEELSIDWETNGIDLKKSIGFALGVAMQERQAWAIPRYASGMLPRWTHEEFRILDREVLIPLLTSDIPKIGSNLPFDISISQTTLGVTPKNVFFDCFIGHHLINNHLGWRSHGLKVMADLYTDMGRYDQELDSWLIAHGYTGQGKADMGRLYLAPDDLVYKYLCADVDAAIRVSHVLIPKIKAENLWDLFVTERLPLALEYQDMDRTGVKVNIPYAHEVSGNLQTALDETKADLSTVAGYEINPNSYPQVATLLYDEEQGLGLPIIARTETGAPSTREEHLVQLADESDAVKLILQYRAYGKLKGYVDGMRGNIGLLAVADEDGYARMNTIIPGTETFRLNTRKPFPLLTWPKTTPGKPSVRKMIVPDDGYVIVSADFSQQEWAIQAIAANQVDMIEAILDRGEDVHEMVMKELGGVTKAQFQNAAHEWLSDDAQYEYKQVRTKWKSVNFMVLFRGGSKKLSRSIKEEEEVAVRYISDYYERFEQIKWWQYARIKELETTGRVVGLFGTYRILPGIWDKNKWTRLEAQRAGCNFPIQDGGAHVMFRAFLTLAWEFRRLKFPARVLFTLHDNIVAQVRRDVVEEGKEIIRRAMEQRFPELGNRSLRTDIVVTDWWE